jgi:hypothetical protein
LSVPGLLVINDGRFEAKDGRGILSFADTAKGDELAAIGRFGFGQKAVFHLCDAFIAHSVGHDVRFSEVVNPCLGVIESTKAKSWDKIGADDHHFLETAAGDIERGLVLWLPLRCKDILPAPKLFFTDYHPTGAVLLDELVHREADLRLILAGMRSLDRLEAFDKMIPRLALQRSQESQRLLGPPTNGADPHFEGIRAVAGNIGGPTARSSRYTASEVFGASERLKQLKQSDNWPQVPAFTAEGEEMQPEKAAEHGAVVVSESGTPNERGVVSLDWGVFLPVVEATRLAADVPNLRILLHGYFFVDSGRRYIDGFDSGIAASQAGTTHSIPQQWNELLRDDLVLPLLPGVLRDAWQGEMLTSTQLAEVTMALRRSSFGRDHRAAIASRDVLARVLKPGAKALATWQILPPGSRLRPLPAPDLRGQVAVAELLPDLCGWADRRGLTLIADQDAALTRSDVDWKPAEIADLLAGLAPEVFLQGGRTAVLAAFVTLAVGRDNARQAAAAGPLLATLRKALIGTKQLAPDEAIRNVLACLPAEAAIALPSSAGERRAILRALALAGNSPLCLRREWLAEGGARQVLSPADAAPLLEALQPLFGEEGIADAAGTAAMALAKLLGHKLDEAARDPAFAQLNVLRASDGSAARLVTLPELVRASREGRLFRESPRVREIVGLMARATPNLGALIVSVVTAELLSEVGGPSAFAEGKKEAFARLIESAQEFGPPEARVKLLERIHTESSDARSALRALAAGDTRAGSARAQLFTLPQAGGRLDDLALRLIEGADDAFLVPTVVARELKPAIQS